MNRVGVCGSATCAAEAAGEAAGTDAFAALAGSPKMGHLECAALGIFVVLKGVLGFKRCRRLMLDANEDECNGDSTRKERCKKDEKEEEKG